MKKHLLIFASICIIALSLCGCANNLMMSWEYKQMDTVYSQWREGEIFTKEDLLNQLGYPTYYTDTKGEHKSDKEALETLKNNLFETGVNKWSYFCYKYPDPAGPYALKVVFDENNNSVVMSLEQAPERWELDEPKINEKILFE